MLAARWLEMAAALAKEFFISSTALELLNEATSSACGRFLPRYSLHWLNDWGCENTTSISSKETGSLALRHCFMGTIVSPVIIKSESWINKSTVNVTAPSILFSIGTTPSSAPPAATTLATMGMDSTGTYSHELHLSIAACSLKDPAGPR